jgi:type VI secretion system protein ImpL
MQQLSPYLVIGPTHSGKSSFILNHPGVSPSLRPVLTEGRPEIQALFNEGGQVWITQKSMFIELSGACFFAQTFLEGIGDLIRAYPVLRGIIVVLDAAAFVQHDLEEHYLLYDIERLNDVLFSLSMLIKSPCPIYIVSSQLDKIAGFQAFFEKLEGEARDKPWGFELTTAEQDDKISAISSHFNDLQHALMAAVIEKLEDISDIEKCRLIQQFPMQIDYLSVALLKWLNKLFTLEFEEGQLWIKGLYMVGYAPHYLVTENVYHPVKSVLKSTYGVDDTLICATRLPSTSVKQAEEESWQPTHYFARELFNLFSNNPSSWRHYLSTIQPPRALKIIGVLACLIGSAGALIYNYKAYMKTLTTVQALLVREKQRHSIQLAVAKNTFAMDLTQSVQRVNELYESLQHVKGLQGFPIQKTSLEAKLQAAYWTALRETLWPCLKTSLLEAIKELNQPPEALYTATKAGLMLQNNLPWEAHFLSLHLTDRVEHFLLKPDLKKHLLWHIQQCISQQKQESRLSHTESQSLKQVIASARERLRTSPPEQLIMFALNTEFLGKKKIYPFKQHQGARRNAIFEVNLEDLALLPQYTLENFASLYHTRIPALVKCWIEGQDPVLGVYRHEIPPNSNIPLYERLTKAVRAAWLNTYANYWREQCHQLKLKEVKDWKQLDQVLYDLQGSNSTLQAFISTLIQHTSWAMLSRQFKQLDSDDRTFIQYYLTRHFETLYDLEYRGETQPYSAFTRQVEIPIQDLHQFLKPVISHRNPQKAAFILTKHRFLYQSSHNDPLAQLFEIAPRLPEPLNHWMDSLACQSRDLLLKSTQQYLNQVWYETVFKHYEATIYGGYPVFKDSQRDISLMDFKAFFGPKGIMMQYIETYLSPFLDKHSMRWQVRQKEGAGIQLASSVLTELERAHVIGALFFPEGHDELNVPFKLKSVNQMAKFDVTLQYGQHLYHGKESDSTRFNVKWPNLPLDLNDDSNIIKVHVQDKSGSRLTYTVSGIWSWFRLLDRTYCDREKTPIDFTIDINPYTVHYQLWPDHKAHPFIKGITECFRCPARLTI